jgi:aspartate/methionine/tyrosine aminotransferase
MLPPFKLESYFAKHEFSTPYMLGSSEPQTYSQSEILALASNDLLELWQHLSLGYTDMSGSILLRDDVSQLYRKQAAENVLVFSGAEEAIYVSIRVLIEPGDQVVVITPCYQSLKELPKACGAKTIEISLDYQEQEWTLDFEKLNRAVSAKTKLIIVNFPHNPTGFLPSKALFNHIIDLAKQHNCYLLSDEVYRYSEHNTEDRLPAAADEYEKALSIGVMSKSFGLPGLRIGWVCAQNNDLLHQLASYKHYTTICNSAPSEILAMIALQAQETIFERINAITKANLDLLEQFFAKYSDLYEWSRPRAGFISFPKLKHSLQVAEFANQLVQSEGVLIIPGDIYDDQNNHFRLGFGKKNLPDALIRFERFTQKLLRTL